MTKMLVNPSVVEQLLELAEKASLPWTWGTPEHRPDLDFGVVLDANGPLPSTKANAALIVAAVNLVEPPARDWQRLKRTEEAARQSFPAIERYYFGEISHKASEAFDEAVVSLRVALVAVSGEPDEKENQ